MRTAGHRYLKEVERHYRVLDECLGTSKFLAGTEYSIADMALWGWANSAGYIFGEKGFSDYPNVKRLVEEIAARPAAGLLVEFQRGWNVIACAVVT